MAQNYRSIMDLLSHIGIYPIPQGLSLVNILKGYILVWIFINFLVINTIVTFHIDLLWCVLSDDNIGLVKDFISHSFWNALIYLINKRKIKIIIGGLDLTSAGSGRLINQLQLQKSLVISNHRSLFDFVLIYYLKILVETKANSSGSALGNQSSTINLSFFNWNTLWKVPSFRTVWEFIVNDENWVLNPYELKESFLKLLSLKSGDNIVNALDNRATQTFCSSNNWIVHFPEVTILNERSLNLQNQQVEQYILPQLNETLYPRFDNFNNVLNVIQKLNETASTDRNDPVINNLIDLSIVYYNPIKNNFVNPTLFEILTLKQPFFIINIDIKIKPINKLPLKQRKLEKWLENDWLEKDKTIELMQKQLKINE